MESQNFRILKRGESREGNYRLLNEPFRLRATVIPVLCCAGSDAWEDDGGATAPPPYEVDIAEKYRREVRIKLGRKQRAARLAVPRESIKVVGAEAPAPREVVAVRLAGGSGQDVQVAYLEAKIKELLGAVRRPQVLEDRRQASIRKFEELFNVERKVR